MADFEIFRVLAQSRPGTTGNTTAYTKPAGKAVTVHAINICNTTNAAVTYRLFVCTNGTTYDQTTALAYDATLGANQTQQWDLPFTLDTTSGTVGVQSSTGSAINFTLIGKIKETN